MISLQTFRRLVAAFNVRSLEIRLHDQTEAMQNVRDTDTRIEISVSKRKTQRELANARARYNELLPVGERRTWRTA